MSISVSVEPGQEQRLACSVIWPRQRDDPRHERTPSMSHGPPAIRGHRAAAHHGGVCGREPL